MVIDSIDKVHRYYFNEENLRVRYVSVFMFVLCYVYISMMDAEKV